MTTRLRALIVGRSREEVDRLTRQLAVSPALEIVGSRIVADLAASDPPPDGIDVVIASPPLFAPRRRAPARDREAGDLETPIESLTAREHDVLTLVADGLGNREVAQSLGISEHTVKFHLASIFGKLGAASRTEAVQRGLRLGLIDI